MLDGRTVIASLPRATLVVAERLGLEPRLLASSADLVVSDLADPDGRVPTERYAALWRTIAADTRSHALLDELARCRSVSALGVVGYVMANSPTVGLAFSAYERHHRVVGDAVGFESGATADGFSLAFAIAPPFSAIPLFGEATLVLNHALVCLLAGRDITPRCARYQHGRLEASPHSERVLGCPVAYGAPRAMLTYDATVASHAVQGADFVLFHFVERHAARLAVEMSRCMLWTDRTRRLIVDQLAHGEPTLATVAPAFGLGARTLQRRLAEEGGTFRDILDACRRDLALRYVEDGPVPIEKIAFLLGYSDASAFQRAFRRWTARTPAQLRSRCKAP